MTRRMQGRTPIRFTERNKRTVTIERCETVHLVGADKNGMCYYASILLEVSDGAVLAKVQRLQALPTGKIPLGY